MTNEGFYNTCSNIGQLSFLLCHFVNRRLFLDSLWDLDGFWGLCFYLCGFCKFLLHFGLLQSITNTPWTQLLRALYLFYVLLGFFHVILVINQILHVLNVLFGREVFFRVILNVFSSLVEYFGLYMLLTDFRVLQQSDQISLDVEAVGK